MRTRTPRYRLLGLAALLAVAPLAACGDDDDGARAGDDAEVTLRLLTHESFNVSEGVLEGFTEETGIEVELVQGGDAGTVVNQAILTNGNPQGDVLFGIDSTFLSRALGEDLFVPYEAAGLDAVDPALLLDDEHRVTPIDYGDVCINFDKAYFAQAGIDPPASLQDLTEPAYKDLLVVENAATSSPGLAFLLASVAEFGEDGWQAWWSDLKANGVQVVDGWEQAYNEVFTRGGLGSGTRPLVVSYASSPPVEVLYADPPIDVAPTGVMTGSCYRQVEGAGILRGTDHEEEAGLLIDFLLSARFQADVPLQMFVFPVNPAVALPDLFVQHAETADDPYELPSADIGEHREEWIGEWTDLVLR